MSGKIIKRVLGCGCLLWLGFIVLLCLLLVVVAQL